LCCRKGKERIIPDGQRGAAFFRGEGGAEGLATSDDEKRPALAPLAANGKVVTASLRGERRGNQSGGVEEKKGGV